ncbi:NTP transferase domain-containing protein (plasmid) [Paracoccus sp. SMMA_5_TC]|nr:NTP transferase domain-containing protein [Paracoccus sp. SMMA_5_TC]UXU82488.1 NTP transferase domain-containing protein [Paracoccus sp. SMMA_5_TC]
MGILLAAGQSRRFGAQNKLLAPCRGQALVTWPAQALLAAGCDGVIAVVSSEAVARCLPPEIRCLRLPPGRPMSDSLVAGLLHARRSGAESALLVLGDMPHVGPRLLRQLLQRPEGAACRHMARRLPPAHLPASAFDTILNAPPGDHGARAWIAALPESALLPVDAATAGDVDRPHDLAGGC